jgi:hypothetical protein
MIIIPSTIMKRYGEISAVIAFKFEKGEYTKAEAISKMEDKNCKNYAYTILRYHFYASLCRPALRNKILIGHTINQNLTVRHQS